MSSVIDPYLIRSSMVSASLANFRIVMVGSAQRQRRDDHVDTGSVLEPRIHHRRRLVDAPADAADDPVDDLHQLLVALERDRAERQLAVLLDVDLLVAVDHDFGDVLAREQLLERTETEDVVDQDLDEAQPVRPAHRDVLLGDHVVEQLGDALAHHLRRHRVGALGELLDEALMHLAAQRDVGVDVAAHLAQPRARQSPPARFSRVGARCGSGAGAGRSASNGSWRGRAERPAPRRSGSTPPGRFCQPAGGNRSLRRRLDDPALRTVPGTTARWGWKAEDFPLPSAALGRATTCELKPPRVIAFEYLPGGWDQASPGCTPNGATILSKQRPRGSEGV